MGKLTSTELTNSYTMTLIIIIAILTNNNNKNKNLIIEGMHVTFL